MKPLSPNPADHFGRHINQLIDAYQDDNTFPSMEHYHIEENRLEEYLSEYQDVAESNGSLQAQETLYGIILLTPIFLLNICPQNWLPWHSQIWSIAIGIVTGVALGLAIRAIRQRIRKNKFIRLRADFSDVATYVDAILEFEKKKFN